MHSLFDKGFDPVGEVDSVSGVLTLLSSDLICESKSGTAGEEEVQCWDANASNPRITTYVGEITLHLKRGV